LLEELFIGADKKEDLGMSSDQAKRDFDLQYRASKDSVFKSLYEYMSLKDRQDMVKSNMDFFDYQNLL
jgi:hypothetical protein